VTVVEIEGSMGKDWSKTRSEIRVHVGALSWSSQISRDRSSGNVIVVRKGASAAHFLAVSSPLVGSGSSRSIHEGRGRRRVMLRWWREGRQLARWLDVMAAVVDSFDER
jgi:hypothetical protein